MDKLKQEEKTQNRVMVVWCNEAFIKRFHEAMKEDLDNAFLNKDKNDK